MARLKGTVIQIRGQCANDIRRRDGEITKMKRHLEGRRGRDGNGGQIGVVVVRPVMSKPQQGGGMHVENDVELGSPEYSLKQESTEFLTRLSQGLSDENDALIGLVRSTLAALRSLQGLPRDSAQGIDQLDNAGIGHNKLIPAPPPSYEDLASSTDEVLEHLRGILTNPSFVPLEELEIREDEIIRLREGWERMEVRWKEAMALMDGWRKRMVNTGDTVNLEELRIGLNLGSEIPPLAFGQEASLPKEDLQGDDLGSSRLCGEVQDNMEEPSQVGFNSSQFYDEAQDDGEEPSTVDVIDDPSIDELSAAAIPTKQVLTARSPNARLPISPQRRAFPTITEENTQQLRDEAQDLPQGISPIKALDSPAKPKSHTVRQVKHPLLISLYPKPSSQRICMLTSLNQSPRSSPHSSTRTVAQKLAQAQAEAEEARLRTETRSRRKASGRGVGRSKGSRRRSTLSPEELEILLGCL